MNIKIFTFYYSNNYGALLQALSLKNFLSKNSKAEVNFSTYQPKELLFREIYRPIIRKNLINSIKNIIKNYRLKIWKKTNKLPKPTKSKKIEKTTLSVYGSDQIWHEFSWLGFQPYYFGAENEGYKISYAASIGPTNLEEEKNKDEIKILLNKFDHISVRDTNTSNLVKELTGKQPQIVVDPIFLTDLSFLNYSKKKIKNFVLIYGIVFSKEEKTKIINFSKLKNLKIISIGYIEFWRGVPLITVLFMSSVMFPMFLPSDAFVDKLIRVIAAIILFEAAYVAEVIRGGLQALPRGQYDAAKSLGMGYWRMQIFVILPQALKLVIPGIANTFLALVKDTPLIFVVGLSEVVGMLQMAKTNPKWLGFAMEGYIFASILFWAICYAMSRYSQYLELKYKTDR